MAQLGQRLFSQDLEADRPFEGSVLKTLVYLVTKRKPRFKFKFRESMLPQGFSDAHRVLGRLV